MKELKPVTAVKRYAGSAHDLSGFPHGGYKRMLKDEHGRQKFSDEGRECFERLPAIPSIYVMAPSGHCAWVPLYCGSGKPDPDAVYRHQQQRWLLEKRFLPVAHCPKDLGLQSSLSEHFPEENLHTAPCQEGHKGGRISRGNPCVCLIEEQQLRMGFTDMRTKAMNKRYRPKLMQDLQSREKRTEALERAILTVASGGSADESEKLRLELAESRQELEHMRREMESLTKDKDKKGKR